MKNLDNDLNDFYDQLILKEKIELHVNGVTGKLNVRIKELATLNIKLKKSKSDLEELDKLSIRNLFSKILVNNEQQYEREKQTYLLFFLQRQECLERIKSKEFELKVLKQKLAQMEGIEIEFEKLLNNKKQRLKFKNKNLAKEIIFIESNIRTFVNMKREITEANDKGKEVVFNLHELKLSLSEIESWKPSINKVNGTFVSIPPYNQKKYAKNLLKEVRKVNISLDDFLDELTDVSNHYQLSYKDFIRRVERFLENFYDGLISDWIFHKEIHVTINLVEETIDKIKRINAMLENDFEDAGESMLYEENKLKEILMTNKI